jgi:hypothetical protein
MSSIRFEGVWFESFPNDHTPSHVHGAYAEVVDVVDLLPDGGVQVADRVNAIKPRNASRSDVKHVLSVATKHFEELVALWEKHHG